MKGHSFFLARFASLMGIEIVSEEQKEPGECVDLKVPLIYQNPEGTFYACIQSGEIVYRIGPMYLLRMGQEKSPRFSLYQILDIVKTIANVLLSVELTDEELIYENGLVTETREQESQEHVLFAIDKDQEEAYHHTYMEECRLLDYIRTGDLDSVMNYIHQLDSSAGRLSVRENNHWRNLAIAEITLFTRAAIEASVSPHIAYQISDFYIRKCDNCQNMIQAVEYRDHAVEEFVRQVIRKQGKKSGSYIEQSKDYIEKNYKRKISLKEAAEGMGISECYLSRLFRQETGIQFQKYVVDVRLTHAANLLKYSDETISRIAEYVNFPSQSYMGKVFREKYHMTPRTYRELNRPTEFRG